MMRLNIGKITTIVISFLLVSNLFAEDLDSYLREKINFFKINPIENLEKNSNPKLFELGKMIFIDPTISGNRNISCMTCHNPKFGSSDGKALSQTHDGNSVLKRNSLSLFNLKNNSHMFWDGRVSFDTNKKIYSTPDSGLNGANPKYKNITNVLNGALSAQVIFPMVNNLEMKGEVGQNEIANAKDNFESWELITKRLLEFPTYRDLFKKAFNADDLSKINIGHVGVALSNFITYQFESTGTPFNQYLKGNNEALTVNQKQGFKTFMERGCIACHQGGSLGLNTFFSSIGTPQFSKGPFVEDRGRSDINNNLNFLYAFRTPSLTNVKLTAPYMHNGAFKTIREVVRHYSSVRKSIDNYTQSKINQREFPTYIEVNETPEFKDKIYNSIVAPFIKRGMALSKFEEDALVDFLENGLTDPKFENLYLVSRGKEL